MPFWIAYGLFATDSPAARVRLPLNVSLPTSEPDVKYASPWTTAFVNGGSGGITTYGANASNVPLFNALYADDKNWGIFVVRYTGPGQPAPTAK